MKVLFLQGLPASGKTTWSKEFLEKNTDWVRVNRDDLRNMRGKYWIPKQEKLITAWERGCIVSTLDEGKNVIVDATNLNPKYQTEVKEFIKALHPDTQFESKFFDCSLDECIKRDLQRENSVGEKVIVGMYDKYIAPPKEYTEDETLPHIVICDIDGTLSIINNRSPYEWDKVGNDLPNQAVINFIKPFKIILFSGRDESCREETEKWLKKHKIKYIGLFMRPEGSWTKDAKIKKAMFEEYIRGKYFIDFVIDDRNQVVDMWRKELGLTCLQVNYGDF